MTPMSITLLFSELKKVGGKSAVYTLGNFIIRSFGFITMPIMTHYLVPAEYGILAMCTVVSNLFGFVFVLGQIAALQKFYYEFSGEDWKTYFTTAVVIITFSGIAVSAIFFTIGKPLLAQIAPGVPIFPHLAIAVGTGFLLAYYHMGMQVLQIREQAVKYVKINTCRALIGLGLLISFLLLSKHKLMAVLLASLFTSGVGFLFFIALFYRELALSFNFRFARRTLRYGLPLLPHSLSGFTIGQIGRIFIANKLNMTTVGLYSIGTTIYSGVETIISGANSAWVPFTFRVANDMDKKEASPLIGKMATYFFLIVWGISFFFAMYGKEIVQILAGEEYMGATVIIAPLMLASVMHAMYYRFVTSIFMSKRTEFVSISTFISAGVSTVLNYLLVPVLGISGSAWATVVTYTVLSALVLVIGQKMYWIAFEWRRMFKLLIVFSFSFALSLLIPVSAPLWQIFLYKFLLIMLAPVSLLAIRFFTAEELAAIKNIPNKVLSSRSNSGE